MPHCRSYRHLGAAYSRSTFPQWHKVRSTCPILPQMLPPGVPLIDWPALAADLEIEALGEEPTGWALASFAELHAGSDPFSLDVDSVTFA